MRRYLYTASSDRGDVGLMAVVAAPFLLVGILALVSASQHLEARRQAQAVAAAAARSASQVDPLFQRDRLISDSATARIEAEARAREFVSQTNSTYGVSVDLSNYPNEVVVRVTVPVDYVASDFGLPAQAEGLAIAVPLEGIQEGTAP